MIRLNTLSCTIGAAVFAAALPLLQLPAMAEDGSAQKVEETPSPPIEPKAVPVILLPPANDALFAFRPPRSGIAVPAATEQPTGNAVPEPVAPAPAKIEADAAIVEAPAVMKRPPDIALQPPASKPPSAPAAAVLPRAEPAKARQNAPVAVVPSLPERAPFRTVFYNVEPVVIERNAAKASYEQAPESASFMGKVKSSFQPLANLWPGNRRASETESPTADGRAAPNAAAASENTDVSKPEPAPFLKSLRFWER